MDVKDTRQRNIVLRHDCKAHMVVGMRAGVWTVTVFNAEHTHPMVSMVGRRRFYRSHRKVPEEDFQLLQTLHNQNISTSKIMGALADVRGGDVRGLPYVKRDVSNIRTMLREAVTLRDVSLTVEYFERTKAENPNFFYATQLDENNAVRALFWVDGRTRSLYHKYKDCVFFDTTFCTNRYNMPFAPIVGINNHTQTIVLGCALLPDESIETFRWVFERWMMAMDNMAPKNIMTDQDKAMATAISKVFPNAIHRCCFYHVLSLARKKLGPNLREGNPFADAFYSCIYGTDTPEEFELCWQHMLQVYEMTDNTHLENMWGSRKTWAPVYFRHNFFPFTSTTGRSEGLNSYFKTLVRPGESVFNFVQQYELCQNLMLDREDNSGFIMETTTAPLWGSWSIEKQAVLFYTREVFDRFQKMLQMSTGFYPLRTELEELCFDLVPNPGLDLRTYRVQVGLEEETYTCGCNQFEMCGLICPHIIRVIVHMNVRSIPEKYMLHRWSMAATTPVPDPGSTGGKFGVPVNNTLKYNSLCRKLNSLAADSCIADDTYAIVLDMVDEAKKVVAAMHRARVAGQQGQGEEHGDATDPRSSNVHHEQQQHGSNLNQQQQEQPVAHETPSNNNLRNPTRVKPKGRPKEKEQRRKPLVELRDEANKKRKKRAEEPKVMKESKPKRQYRKKKCPFCNEEGHNLKECEYMVLAKQFKDAKDSELEKTV
ncbi:hypothetical protein QYE76_066002 [Lolium multiflorum]|uniref:Protein FAR1-RELATED SEQUENCE n=1 Tax=Lolium multiflorum TaxID=4521 RepID=A0AAD8WBP3_LOLMU|nr:hypothetical protein QYE76_066002 [Lolium multiflorum]